MLARARHLRGDAIFPLSLLLRKLVRKGRLTVVDHKGRPHVYQGEAGPEMTVRLHDAGVNWAIASNPGLKAGEAFMDGRLTVEGEHDIRDFVDLVLLNMAWEPDNPLHELGAGGGKAMVWLRERNLIGRAKANVAHHYDLSDALYDLFLDRDRQYSCGYFRDGVVDLETAQHDKKAHIAAKLLLEPDHKVLDIGCGWGGMGLYLNSVSGADVTGITLSEEQLAVANARAAETGVADRVRFGLTDYRDVGGRFDRVVSVGMFEHVGRPNYRAFFDKCRSLLTDDGVMLLHTIGRADGPGGTNPWIRKYIFPGGYSPSLSEIATEVEKAGLYITDVEVLRLHYAETLKAWWDRIQANRDRIVDLYDERFARMWEFYIAASEMTFRHVGHVVFQVQLARRQDAAPLTRDYMVDAERELLTMGRGRQDLAG